MKFRKASIAFIYSLKLVAFLLCGAAFYLLYRAVGFGLPLILILAAAVLILAAAVFQMRYVKKVVERFHWYESLLDAIPFAISVTDMDMNWTFINKPATDMLGTKRSEVLGQPCSNWNAGICNTENCGIARLRKGELQTRFAQLGRDFQVDSSYILNKKGQQTGHIEVVQDITRRETRARYRREEVAKIAANMRKLSAGELQLDFSVNPGNEHTTDERINYEEINRNFKIAMESISMYISELSDKLDNLAGGDLSHMIDAEFKGDFAGLKTAINRITVSMSSTLSGINTAAEQVAGGTLQVSEGSQAISQGATEQAGAIEELSATLAQIADQTKQNADSASRANELTLAAKRSAALGDGQMKAMQGAMAEINEASESISRIIKVIDDIAFQTNILSLNAAVEAARAGIHGKGFAVVADEVRNLAARSASAAKETTALIEGSMKKTAAGTKIANETAAALSGIIEGVDKAAQLVSEIAAASGEQADAIAQVNRGIEQMSQVVQSNSATSEEAAASVEELSSQAELLKSMVGHFKLQNAVIPGKGKSVGADRHSAAHTARRPQIELNDNEFGKY